MKSLIKQTEKGKRKVTQDDEDYHQQQQQEQEQVHCHRVKEDQNEIRKKVEPLRDQFCEGQIQCC
jgi:hypothetical protein